MIVFRDFTGALWNIFIGNALMVITIGFYIAWWVVLFRPDRSGQSPYGPPLIVIALVAGAASIVFLIFGISSQAWNGKDFPGAYFLLGALGAYVILLGITKSLFRRPVTSELLLIVLWSTLEWSVITVLKMGDRLSSIQALTLMVLLGLAACIGLVCYVLFYRLDGTPRFWDGLIPLIVDGLVVITILGALTFFSGPRGAPLNLR
jgi:hypothetical protein